MGGCAVHQAGFDQPLETPEAFEAGREDPDAERQPDEWWRAFGDERLDALQDMAISENFDLETFRDRLRAARAVIDREESALFPSVDYSLLGEQTRRQDDGFDAQDRFGGSLIGSYEVDVWERNANIVRGAEFDRAIVRQRLDAAAISLSADVALTWYALVEAWGQSRVLEEQIETNRSVLKVVRLRFAKGVVRLSDVLRQEQLLESTREQRAVVRGRIDRLEHALLVLTGRSPTGSLGDVADELPGVPERPALGLPSDLMSRRPDIRSAMLAIRSADAQVAVAVADKYPSVTLGLNASTIEANIGDLFDDWAATLRVDVLGPIFDAGAREAEVERARAVKAERINAYAQTVLRAFEQVVNAVSNENAREEQITRLRRQLELARRTSQRLNREYLNGDISYIDVLDALTNEQRLQRDLLSARFERIGDRIALYRALAGGWEGIDRPRSASDNNDPRHDQDAKDS